MAATDASVTALNRLSPVDATTRIDQLLSEPYQYRHWEDVYRQEWTWDKVVHVSHLRTNCISACSLDAYVKDGIVWREEQNANYPKSFDDVPDFNPRGCPGGCAYSVQMYDPTRIRYPLKRVGERGGGQWERVSWDQALTEIADKLLDVIVNDGPECILYDQGTTNIDNGIGSTAEGNLFSNGLNATYIDSWAGVGDLPTGFIQCWGTYMSEGTADDWYLSDYILIWIGNPNYTRVTDAHFIWEARYRGAKVVSIAPDFSPSTPHADRWLNVRVGTDAALALGMVNVILEENLYDAEYIKEQTDLPFLVRADTGKFLRESDVEEDGSDEEFYFWNGVNGRKTIACGTWGSEVMTLELDDDEDPQLEGWHTVKLLDGKRVRVRPVFELLKKHAGEYTPEVVSKITGVAPGNIRRVAREMAAARSSMIWSSWGACKHYHSDLFQRGMVYLMALTGNSGGKPGSGIKVSTWWPMPGMVLSSDSVRMRTEPPPPMPVDRVQMQDVSKMMFEMTAAGRRTTPLIPFLYAHDEKWREMASSCADPALKRPIGEYMDEIFEKNWQPISPALPRHPKFFFFSGPNPLRRWPNSKTIRDGLWQKIDTIVTTDFRMSTSGMWADYILPACGYYEKPGIKYVVSALPYVLVGDRAVEPLYESRHEWDISLMMAKKIQERAKARGIDNYVDDKGAERTLSAIYDEMSADGVYVEGEEGETAALDYILQNSATTKASDLGEQPWAKAVEDGMIAIKDIKPVHMAVGLSSVMSDFDYTEPLNQFAWFIKDKNPWPTLTGRQQFYIDHDWFMEVGEQLTTHKEPLPAGGDYPLRLVGGHTRWSQHAIFRANEQLLRLQRGQPVAYISQADARDRGIEDNDQVKLYNDVGELLIHVKVSPSVQPGEVICYHAWESYQFPDGANQNHLAASPLKPNNMIGGYGHLQYRGAYLSMNNIPKEVAVDMVLAGGEQ